MPIQYAAESQPATCLSRNSLSHSLFLSASQYRAIYGDHCRCSGQVWTVFDVRLSSDTIFLAVSLDGGAAARGVSRAIRPTLLRVIAARCMAAVSRPCSIFFGRPAQLSRSKFNGNWVTISPRGSKRRLDYTRRLQLRLPSVTVASTWISNSDMWLDEGSRKATRGSPRLHPFCFILRVHAQKLSAPYAIQRHSLY